MEALEPQQTPAVFKRSTAIKLRIADINQGSFQEKMFFLKTGEQASRVRVMGTVVAKHVSDDGTFGNITVDDSTDTIRAKSWDDVKILEKINIGDIVDLVGKVKIYNEEIYVVPEIVIQINDPNFELLRKLELIKKYGKLNQPKTADATGGGTDKIALKKQILELIEESKEGISYIEIIQKIKASQAEIEYIINDLLSGGLCYEPSPGIIRKI